VPTKRKNTNNIVGYIINGEMASNEITIELGDFIKIISPTKAMYHLKTFLVEYIDDETIEIIDIDTADIFKLDLYDDGRIMDEQILAIHLLSRSAEPGYARIHKLLPGTWITIEFDPEIDLTIVGQIVDLEEDRIKILPKNDTKTPMYIDFAYQGIPKNIPIKKISIIETPSIRESLTIIGEIEEEIQKSKESAVASIETTPSGEFNIIMPPNPAMDKNMFDVIKDIYVQADTIVFGKRVEVELDVEVSQSEQKYGIEIQVNNLMDELLSKTPTHMRTPALMERVKRIVRRFKELREEYSVFDDYGNVLSSKTHNASYKPLVEQLKTHKGVRWIIPVSKQQLKLFNVPGGDGENTLINDLETYTNAVNMVDSENRYYTFHNRINNIFTPYESSATDESVTSNIEAIISNLDDYSSVVYKKFKGDMILLKKQRFVIQRYNLGLTKINKQLMKSGKYVYTRGQVTPHDKINASSIVILPQPMIEVSRTQLPGTSILDRTNLAQNWLYYFQILNKKTSIKTINVRGSTEIDYDKIEKNPLLTHVINFGKTSAPYPQLLQASIPRSVSIIRMLKSQINRYNFHDIMAHFEPFGIYSHNITYSGRVYGERSNGLGGPYQEIRTHIGRKIKEYNIQYAEKRHEFAALTNIKSAKPIESPLYTHIRNGMALESVRKYYQLENGLSNTEMMRRIMAADGGRAYMNLISYISSHLYTPELAEIADKVEKKEAFTNSKSCITRVIAKKYISESALKKDNGKEDIYFDRDYDKTPYHLLNSVREAQKKRTNEDFLDYFRLVLIAEHGASPDLADDLAKTIIAKRKKVVDGNYAVLVVYPQPDPSVDVDSLSLAESKNILDEAESRKRITYFVRKRDHWVKDDTMTEQELSNELFCNIENKCFYDSLMNSCDADAAAASRMKKIARKSIGKEYETTIQLSMADMTEKLKAQLENGLTDLKRIQRIHGDHREMFSRYSYKLGTEAVFNEIVVSPYAPLLSLILKQADFAKQQYDIVRFKGAYCREAVENEIANETPYWYYCQETNVKLMPTFLFVLANTFVSKNDYESVQEWLCSKFGKLSDDGEAIVDKHSGYIIKKLDYAAEDSYDDAGFKISTNAVLEPDEYQMVRELINKNEPSINQPKTRVFENDTNLYIYGISSTICKNMDIRFEDIEANVMYLTNMFLSRKTMTRDTYEAKMSKIAVKEGKKAIPYEKYLNKNIIQFASAITYILIQTNIPSYKPRKSFPGCKYSLAGYPLGLDGDTSGLDYLGCIMDKMKSKSVEPWKSVYKSDQTAVEYTAMVLDVIKTKLIEEPEIVDLYNGKRDFLRLTPEIDEIPESLSISKWVFFQPPLSPISVSKTLTGIANGYETELKTTIMRGHRTQHNLLGTLYKKIIEHTYGLVEEVNRIVAVEGKEAILRTGTVVFLENACCGETFHKSNAISYFEERQPNITKNIDFVKKYGQLYAEFAKLTTPSYLTTGKMRALTQANLGSTHYTEDAIYGAYIHYCKLNSELPIPDDIIPFCQEKPPGLENMSHNQMIEHLKDTRNKQNEDSLVQLMKLVSNRNRVVVDMEEPKNPKFMDAFEGLALDPLITYVHEFFAHKRSSSFLAEYLTEMIDVMRGEIAQGFESFGKRSTKEIGQLMTHMNNLMTWNNTQMTHDFIVSSIYMVLCALPSMLEDTTNSVGMKNMMSMKHWDLSKKHNAILNDLISEYYMEINTYKHDEIICKLFHAISAKTHKLHSLIRFLKHIPQGLNQVLTNKIYVYCYLSVFYEIFMESDKPDYTQLNIELVKDRRRRQEMEEVDIMYADNVQFKEKVCELVMILMKMDIKNKKLIDLDYGMLTDKHHKESMREKKKITDSFGKMETDERKVEYMIKSLKLGKWYLGQESGIYKYDPALFDTEVDEMADDTPVEATDLEHMVMEEAQNEEDAEANNMDFGEDYYDGNYYDEDRDVDRD